MRIDESSTYWNSIDDAQFRPDGPVNSKVGNRPTETGPANYDDRASKITA